MCQTGDRMKRFQVKCRRCRHWLMSEDSIVDSHGHIVQGDQGNWYCGKEQEQRTHLFVCSSFLPPFIVDAVEEACYTQGKLNCPKCQGRLGSFDLVRLSRKCACGQTPLPPIHLLLNRVDLLPSSPTFLSTVVTPAFHALTEAGTGHQSSRDSHTVSVPTTLHENQTTADANSVVVGVGEVNDTLSNDDDDIVEDLRWLFAQSPPAPYTGESGNVMVNSEGDASQCAVQKCCQLCFDNLCVCPSKGKGSSYATGRTDPHCSIAAGSSTGTSLAQRRTANSVSGSQRVRLYRDNYCPDRTTAGLDSVQNRPRPVISTLPENIMPKARRRERRERRWNRNGDCLDMRGNNMNATCVPEPDNELLVSRFILRQMEKRDWEESERRQLHGEEVESEHSCPVCLDVLFSPYTTRPCAHNFCQGCLRQLSAVTSPDKCICPLCRRKIAECTPNTELEASIQDKYPAHLRRRRREEKRHSRQAHRWHTQHTPLPGLPFPQRLLSKLPTRADSRRYVTLLTRASSRRWLAVVAVSVFLVIALSSVGLEICKHVLARLATVYDDLTERLTGERLWSQFLGVESRALTVSCVFVLYLLVACIVHYLQLFQHGQFQRN